MAKEKGMGAGSEPSETKLRQKTMTQRGAQWPDASTRCKGGSVNDASAIGGSDKGEDGILGGRTA